MLRHWYGVTAQIGLRGATELNLPTAITFGHGNRARSTLKATANATDKRNHVPYANKKRR
jgi:hypothetical protein